MAENKAGRKTLYSYEDLVSAVERFALTNVGEEITIPKLVKFSEIPRHIWRYNEDIKKVISTLNERSINVDSANSDLCTLPNIKELVETNYKNKDKLIKALSDYTDYINSLYQNALGYQKEKEKNEGLEKEILELKQQLKAVYEDVEFYKNEMKKMTIDSISLKKRKEQNIKDNVISITAKNKNMAGATASKMLDLMSDLFE